VTVKNYKTLVGVAFIVAMGIPLMLAHPAFAADGSAGQLESYIKSVTKVVVGLTSLVATAFFVIGGLKYITSSGNPERLDGAKNTLKNTAIGLTIVMGAVVITNIVTDLATKAFGS
jgi:multisubunit Na+/H+ antiporter MnhC subunit